MHRTFSLLLAGLLACSAFAQDEPAPPAPNLLGVNTTIESIAALEGRRDPKCYATASRLENFMYGTPLSDEARFAKIELQKRMIRVIWSAADARAAGPDSLTANDLEPVLQEILPHSRQEGGDWRLQTAGDAAMVVEERDLRQYGNVAYALRALLAVQHEQLFVEGASFAPLDSEATARLKTFLDLYTLAALQRADRAARDANQYELRAEALVQAWGEIGHEPSSATGPSAPGLRLERPGDPYLVTRSIVRQKIASYEVYNRISLPVFLRNIQVYFARHRWPSGEELSNRMKARFTETMIAYSSDLLLGAEQVARKRKHDLIRVDDVQAFAQLFVPHEIDYFEDATFFPRLPREDRVFIEAYDMDAFRDGGLHWQYLQAAIDAPDFEGSLPPDPFALELLTENIAQFGVLALRVAGDVATEKGEKLLAIEHLDQGLRRIQDRVDKHAKAPAPEPASEALVSAKATSSADGERPFFSDVTAESGVAFRHRSADWLNRMIRSYTIRGGDTAVLAVPPAFGGSGAAGEDFNEDGFPDLLLLSGSGNKLYLGDGTGGFKDATEEAGIDWRRADGLPGEPRQPVVADFDNDGHQDIFISYVDDPHRLYRGRGDGSFEDVSGTAGLGGAGLVGGPACAMDFDNDGLLDLYIGYFGMYTEGILPTLARRNVNGLSNRLFRNRGGMKFEDVTAASGVGGAGWTQAVGHTDFDRDGWQDLIEGNDFGVNAYYRNNHDGTFTDLAAELGTDKPSYTMSVGIGDLNGDLFPDIYISNIVTMDKDQKYVDPSTETTMRFDPKTMATMRVVEANDFFVSQVEQGVLKGFEQSELVGRGRSSTGWAWGADFFDFDNDGDDDLYVANGMNEFAVYSAENPYYRDPEGNERDVLFPESTRETNVFFLNEGGKLENASERSGANLYGNSRAVVYADLDRDGDLDMVLNNYHEDAVIYRNNAEASGNHWLSVRLIGNPEQGSTRDAIGAVLILKTSEGETVWREVHAGSGYLTTHPKEQHFGLGASATADLTVHWPGGGVTQHAGLSAGHRYTVSQNPNGAVASASK